MLRDLGQLSPDHKRGVEGFGLVPGRHANVDNHEVGVLIADDAGNSAASVDGRAISNPARSSRPGPPSRITTRDI
jgi:hypothetical protein